MEEETEKEEDFFEPQEPTIFNETAPFTEPTPNPIISLPLEKASPTEQADMHKKAIGTAMKSMPNTLLSLDAMKLPSIPLLSSTQKGLSLIHI